MEKKEKNPEKFIEINDALEMEKTDQGIFSLALISKSLENSGINVLIEKDEGDTKESDTFLELLSNGMIYKKKYDLVFDFGNEKNTDILDNKGEYDNFKNKLKKKLSKIYNIPEDEIIITYPQKGSIRV